MPAFQALHYTHVTSLPMPAQRCFYPLLTVTLDLSSLHLKFSPYREGKSGSHLLGLEDLDVWSSFSTEGLRVQEPFSTMKTGPEGGWGRGWAATKLVVAIRLLSLCPLVPKETGYTC